MTTVTALLPEPGVALDLEGDGLRAWLSERYRLDGERRLRLNLVSGLAGQITGPSGTSDDLAGGIDRTLLGVLRADAQVVLVGAGTLRTEGYALPRRSSLAVATLTGRIEPASLPEPDGDRRVLVLCPDALAADLAARLGDRAGVLAVAGDPEARAGLLVDALAAEGLHRVVCEGGGRLATALLADGAVDEFDQTIAPVLAAPAEPLVAGPLPPGGLKLAGLLHDGTDRLYARWCPLPR